MEVLPLATQTAETTAKAAIEGSSHVSVTLLKFLPIKAEISRASSLKISVVSSTYTKLEQPLTGPLATAR